MKTLLFLSLLILATHGAHAENAPRLESAQTLFKIGLSLRQRGQVDQAERYLKRALEFAPANRGYRFELANIYAIKYDEIKGRKIHGVNASMLEMAARELEQVVMIDPDFMEGRFNLGVVRKKQGRYEEAREEFRRVLEMNPMLVNAHLQIAAIYESQGFFDEANDSYLRAKELDFANPGIRDALDNLKDVREADRERMLNQSPQEFSALRSRFQYAPGSNASQYSENRWNERESGNSIQSAVPYLTLWLVDQFMKTKENN